MSFMPLLRIGLRGKGKRNTIDIIRHYSKLRILLCRFVGLNDARVTPRKRWPNLG